MSKRKVSRSEFEKILKSRGLKRVGNKIVKSGGSSSSKGYKNIGGSQSSNKLSSTVPILTKSEYFKQKSLADTGRNRYAYQSYLKKVAPDKTVHSKTVNPDRKTVTVTYASGRKEVQPYTQIKTASQVTPLKQAIRKSIPFTASTSSTPNYYTPENALPVSRFEGKNQQVAPNYTRFDLTGDKPKRDEVQTKTADQTMRFIGGGIDRQTTTHKDTTGQITHKEEFLTVPEQYISKDYKKGTSTKTQFLKTSTISSKDVGITDEGVPYTKKNGRAGFKWESYTPYGEQKLQERAENQAIEELVPTRKAIYKINEKFKDWNKKVSEKTTKKILPAFDFNKRYEARLERYKSAPVLSLLKKFDTFETNVEEKYNLDKSKAYQTLKGFSVINPSKHSSREEAFLSFSEKRASLGVGMKEGAYTMIRDKPLTVGAYAGLGLITGGAIGVVGATSTGSAILGSTAVKVGEIGLIGLYGGAKTYQVATEKDYRKKGNILGETAVEVGALYGGALVGYPIGAKVGTKANTMVKEFKFNRKMKKWERTITDKNTIWGKEYTTTRKLTNWEKQLINDKYMSSAGKQEIIARAGGSKQYGIPTQKGIQTQLKPSEFEVASSFYKSQQPLEIAKGVGDSQYLGKFIETPKYVPKNQLQVYKVIKQPKGSLQLKLSEQYADFNKGIIWGNKVAQPKFIKYSVTQPSTPNYFIKIKNIIPSKKGSLGLSRLQNPLTTNKFDTFTGVYSQKNQLMPSSSFESSTLNIIPSTTTKTTPFFSAGLSLGLGSVGLIESQKIETKNILSQKLDLKLKNFNRQTLQPSFKEISLRKLKPNVLTGTRTDLFLDQHIKPRIITLPKIKQKTKPRTDLDYFSPSITTPSNPIIDNPLPPDTKLPDPFILGFGYPNFRLRRGKNIRSVLGKQKKKYTPSYFALSFGIKGKAPKSLTGLEIRPISVKRL